MSSFVSLASVLFLATAALCLTAELARSYELRRFAAMAAVLAITLADAAMLGAMPGLGLAWPEWLPSASEHHAGRRRQRLLEYDSSGQQGARDERDGRAGGNRDPAPEAGDEGDEENEVEVIIEPARRRALSLVSGLFAQPARKVPEISPWDTFKDCPECPELVVVPAGETTIGAPLADPLATASEQPARRVRVWPGFAIARFEISARELAASGIERSAAAGRCAAAVAHDIDRRPVAATCVTWNEALEYAAWLVRHTGKRYRLVSAAEWEYAARLAGAPRQVAEAAPLPGTSGTMRSPLGPYPLALGGGVGEYTQDCWAGTLENASETSAAYLPHRACWRRVLKDGSDHEPARWRRPSARRAVAQDIASPDIGFRVVRDLATSP